MTDARRPARRRWLIPAIAIPLLALVALVSWGFASPVGAGPDDDYHLASIWCGSGTTTEMCEPGDADDERRVSPDIERSAVCYAFLPEQSAGCQGSGGGTYGDDLTTGLVSTSRGNFDGSYPPVYYFVMSAFAGEDLQTSALLMRIANSALFVGLVTALFFLLPIGRRPTLIASIAVSVVPLGMFLIPSNNPSGWAILAAGTLWMSLVGFFETRGARRVALAAVALVSTVIGAGSRADSAIYSVIAIGVVLLLKLEWNRRFLKLAIVPLAMIIPAVLIFFSSRQSSAATSGLDPNFVRPEYGPFTLVVDNLLQVPGLWFGVFGTAGFRTSGLGWLDTEMPAIVSFGALGAFVAVIAIAFGTQSRRKTIAALGTFALLLLIPWVILFQSQTVVGDGVQPRYLIPLVVLFAGIALFEPTGRRIRITREQLLAIAVALAVANAVALHYNIRRYVTGVDLSGGNLDTAVEWWWSIPVSPMGMWAIGGIAFGVMTVWLALFWSSRLPQATADDELVEPGKVRLAH
jgi:hypothetical protein